MNSTISRRKRSPRADLSGRITLLFEDYRDLKGQFDKLVSIEMIEAVGARYLDTYFAKCSSLLKASGAMLLQAITLQDQYYARALKSVDYIQRFVFPGSFIPSVTAIADSVTRVTDMKLFNLEDIGPHYAPTLRMWRETFLRQHRPGAQPGLSGELRPACGSSTSATARVALPSGSWATCRCC